MSSADIAYSQIFRDMILITNDPTQITHELRMTDETIETATILRHFVDLITGRKLPTPSDISSVDMPNIIHPNTNVNSPSAPCFMLCVRPRSARLNRR